MKSTLLFIVCSLFINMQSKADRIFLMNSPGFQSATPALITAISNNGHVVVQNTSGVYTLPAGFTTSCLDSVNGYDWLCFFGNEIYSGLLSQIQTFIDNGGKVFYQYEVSCCTASSSSAATIISGLTGLSITPNANAAIAATALPGWIATNVNCCATIKGAAYKGMDGLPVANQLQASANLGGSTPIISTCPNFGFVFATNDFVGTAHHGGIIGFGDFNPWFDGLGAGTGPIYQPLVNFIFPNDTSTCYIFPPGCLLNYSGTGSFGISLNLGNDTILCSGQTLLLDATNIGATYLWQNGSTNPTFNVTQAGTYWVKVSTSCGMATDTIHIDYASSPMINLGNDTSICIGQTLTLNASTMGATYLWQNGSTNSTFPVTIAGSYWVQVTTNCGTVTDTIQVNMLPAPIVNLGNDTILCEGQSLVLNAGNPGATYLWQNGSVSPIQTVTQSGIYWVNVSNGCSMKDSILVTFTPLPIINLGNDKTLCFGESIVLDATYPSASYLWQNGSFSSTYTVTASGQYWVELSANNCSFRDTIKVTINKEILIDLGPSQMICKGDTVLLNALNSGATYQWQDNSSTSTFIATQTGLYWVQVSYGSCLNSDSVYLQFDDPPFVNLGPDISLCPGETILLDAGTPNATYLWQDFSENSTYLVSTAGTYSVQVTQQHCVGEDEIIVDYQKPNCVCTLFLPNAFSPNNDFLNDELKLIDTKDIKLDEFRIFNRWGNEVFKSENIEFGWNGNYNGEPSETGIYFYLIKYHCANNAKAFLLKGDITLIR